MEQKQNDLLFSMGEAVRRLADVVVLIGALQILLTVAALVAILVF